MMTLAEFADQVDRNSDVEGCWLGRRPAFLVQITGFFVDYVCAVRHASDDLGMFIA
jgi:hypothetical protein